MPTRLVSVVIDSADAPALARWWAEALGWNVTLEDDEESDVEPPDGQPGITLTFCPVPEGKAVLNRIHLDLRSEGPAEQQELVGRLIAAGATPADVGQGDVPWTVLADPEGNEFCVLDPRPRYAGTGAIAAIVVKAREPETMGQFWSVAAEWDLQHDDGTISLMRPDGQGPWLEFVQVPEPHTVKNRVHLDVAPYEGEDQAQEVARLLMLGALRAEIGQSEAPPGAVTWVVLTDPEQNEFCVLSPRGDSPA